MNGPSWYVDIGGDLVSPEEAFVKVHTLEEAVKAQEEELGELRTLIREVARENLAIRRIWYKVTERLRADGVGEFPTVER
jgi:regulator of replication initiation timing